MVMKFYSIEKFKFLLPLFSLTTSTIRFFVGQLRNKLLVYR
jgi:hypothetical protein